MSKRSNKHAQTVGGGVAVTERPAATEVVLSQADVDEAVAKVKAKHPELTQADIDRGLSALRAKVAPATPKKLSAKQAQRLARLQVKPDAPVTEPSVVAAVAEAVKQTAAKPQMAAEVQVGDMIATSYFRKPGSSMLSGESGSWGALVQTAAMQGSLKGRCCRHQHPTSAEAVACATATIGALRAAA